MVQELFSGILDAMRSSIQHLRNADTLTLALVVGGIVLIAFLLLRR